MKSKLLIVLLIISLILCSSGASYSIGDYRIYVNGIPLKLDTKPINREGRVLVPVRAIFEALGADVKWDPSQKTVTGTKSNITVVLKIGSTSACINGQDKLLDVPALIISNRTLVPLRFVSESLNMDIKWDDTGIININSKPNNDNPSQTPVPTAEVTPTPSLQTPIVAAETSTPDTDNDPYNRLLNRVSRAGAFSGMSFAPYFLGAIDNDNETYLNYFCFYRLVMGLNNKFTNLKDIFWNGAPAFAVMSDLASKANPIQTFKKGDYEIISVSNSEGAIIKASILLQDLNGNTIDTNTYYIAALRRNLGSGVGVGAYMWYIYDCELIK